MTLKIENITVQLGTAKIVNNLSLELAKGETVGVIGPNGSGKTTLFNAISGFLPISEGSIKFNESDISNLPPYARAIKGIGRVFQNSGIFHEMTLAENILVACEAKNNSISKAEILSCLRDVGLDEHINEKAGSLSGGQKRLLEIQRAFISNSELFLLDEPTAGVSPKMKHELIRLIKMLQEKGKSILVIEHDMNFISEFAPRIVVLNQGQLILDNTPENVRADSKLKEIYFGK